MLNRNRKTFIALLVAAVLLLQLDIQVAAAAQEQEPVVRAVLFYSPTCPHCHKVISEDLPPLFEKYGSQLDIRGIDISQPEGQILYNAAIERFNIPNNRLGVPTLVIGYNVLVGSLEIPEQLPGLIEYHLANGGLDWPDIPGLKEALNVTNEQETVPAETTSAATGIGPEPQTEVAPEESETPSVESTPVESETPSAESTPEENEIPVVESTPAGSLVDMPAAEKMTVSELFAQDLAGNSLAVVVLVLMVVLLIWAIVHFIRTPGTILDGTWSLLIPLICVVGLGVAGYLAYVEVTATQAVCGPVGDCNTVQQSEYARLFGILPIGVLGLGGYLAIILAWFIGRYVSGRIANLAILSILGMSLFGVLFSIYLTFLEPFVIGATCAWCLTSAILMTILLWLSISPGKLAYMKMFSAS